VNDGNHAGYFRKDRRVPFSGNFYFLNFKQIDPRNNGISLCNADLHFVDQGIRQAQYPNFYDFGKTGQNRKILSGPVFET
jgi:hypothetical protein